MNALHSVLKTVEPSASTAHLDRLLALPSNATQPAPSPDLTPPPDPSLAGTVLDAHALHEAAEERYAAALAHAKASHGVVPAIHNVVATVNLGKKLDLKILAQSARNAEYNPKRFAAVIMRIRDPKATALIFESGKMVITGARSYEAARLAGRKFARIIQRVDEDLSKDGQSGGGVVRGGAATPGASAGSELRFRDFKIQNVVGGCDFQFPVRLEGLYMRHHTFSHYEPELFPGLIYRMVVPKVVLIIFASGKVIVTGARSRADVFDATNAIHPVLCEHRKVVANKQV